MFSATTTAGNCAAPTRLTSPDPTRERKPLAGPFHRPQPRRDTARHSPAAAFVHIGPCYGQVSSLPRFLRWRVQWRAPRTRRPAYSTHRHPADPPAPPGGSRPPDDGASTGSAAESKRFRERALACRPHRTACSLRARIPRRRNGSPSRAGPNPADTTRLRRVPSPAIRPARRPFSPSVVLAGHSPNRERH